MASVKYTLPEINKLPFIIILHSLGKNETQAINFSNLITKNAFVLSIRGRMDWKVDGDDSFAWFDIKGPMIENFSKESDIIESVDYIIKIIDECKNKFNYLDDPIILGFSQGGIVALTMVVENYYKLKGVYSHCGFYEKKLDKGLKDINTNILMSNGNNDYVIPSVWVEESHKILEKKCNNFCGVFLDSGHEITQEVIDLINTWLNKII